MTVAFLKYELADRDAGMQGQGRMPQIHDFQNLVVGDARMHETGGNVNSQPKTGKPASPFEPAGDIIGESDFFPGDSQNHLTRFYDDGTAVLHVYLPGNIPEMRIIFYVIDLRSFLENPEIIAESKIDGTRSDLRFVEWFDPDQFIL